MTAEELVRAFEPWRKKHERSAHVPVVGADASRSRFGGLPDMRAEEAWPVCGECDEPMSFFLQLDLSALPERAEPGLLQLFYCSVDDGDCEVWVPFSDATRVRIVSGELERREAPDGVTTFPEKSITGWKQVVDRPNPQDHHDLGVRYEYDFQAGEVRIVCPDIDFDVAGLDIEACSAEAISTAREGDKLFGWPHWIQGAEYPACPECGARMEVLLQIDSEDNIPYMFGDSGIGHITRCATHPNVVTFAWACC